jgi:hypothetical protein
MRFVYSGLLFCDAKGRTTEKSTLRKRGTPAIGDTIQFDHDYLKITACLKRTDNPIISTLFKDSDGNELIWDCHHPNASAEIIYKGDIYKGPGYSETLFCPVKPWDLPIDELKWGRFLSDSATVIWISWQGKVPINKIFYNGIEFNDAVFGNDIIIFGDGAYKLSFSEKRIIRRGKLSGLFSKMAFLKIFFNRRILNTMEIKYKARTSFSKNAVFLSDGWSLFEVVTWGK